MPIFWLLENVHLFAWGCIFLLTQAKHTATFALVLTEIGIGDLSTSKVLEPSDKSLSIPFNSINFKTRSFVAPFHSSLGTFLVKRVKTLSRPNLETVGSRSISINMLKNFARSGPTSGLMVSSICRTFGGWPALRELTIRWVVDNVAFERSSSSDASKSRILLCPIICKAWLDRAWNF